MYQEIFILSLTLVTLLVINRGARKVVYIIFWIPLIIYIYFLFGLLRFFALAALRKVRYREFGYVYKLCNTAIYKILKEREVDNIMKGVRFDQTHNFTCKCDEELPKEKRTIFETRYLTAKEQAKIRDGMYMVSGIGAARREQFRTGSATQAALELGLKGWKNFKQGDTGEDISFDVDNFSCIPPNERDEISNHIRGIEEGEVE